MLIRPVTLLLTGHAAETIDLLDWVLGVPTSELFVDLFTPDFSWFFLDNR
jgi:hypothetical protein